MWEGARSLGHLPKAAQNQEDLPPQMCLRSYEVLGLIMSVEMYIYIGNQN